MRKIALALLFASQASFSYADALVDRVIDQFIVPGYTHFQEQAVAQQSTLQNLCTQPSTENLDAARTQFGQLVEGWAGIEMVRFGPVIDDNRIDRILFWPDRKSTGLKQIQRAIYNEDQTVLALDSLTQKSVALQGVNALEFILFGTNAYEQLATEDGFRCRYGLAVSAAMTEVASQLVTAWTADQGVPLELRHPEPTNDHYRSIAEAKAEIVAVLAHGPGIIFDTRLKNYLGSEQSKAKPKAALFWRSGLTFKSMQANARSLGKLATIASFNDELHEDKHWIADSYVFETKNAVRATSLDDVAVLDAVISKSRSKLTYLEVVLASLSDIAGTDLAAALGLSTGFSSLDGD